MARGTSEIPVVLKYELYESSVQNHMADIEFIEEEFKTLRGRKPRTLREDFGGTGAMACDWVKQHKDNLSWAVDLDPEPIKYGKENHYTRLNKEEAGRVKYIQGNVLDKYDFDPDVVVAFNFSYFCFKRREDLLKYFKKVRKALKKDGVFFVDIFGGTECYQEMVEETEFDKHSYFWDCDSYNPLTNDVLYYIHFESKGMKYEKVFVYDWRHWTVREITELMEEAGFSKVITYWEGEDDDGEGDGDFYQSKEEENCESWVTYIVGLV